MTGGDGVVLSVRDLLDLDVLKAFGQVSAQGQIKGAAHQQVLDSVVEVFEWQPLVDKVQLHLLSVQFDAVCGLGQVIGGVDGRDVHANWQGVRTEAGLRGVR